MNNLISVEKKKSLSDMKVQELKNTLLEQSSLQAGDTVEEESLPSTQVTLFAAEYADV